MCLMPHNFLMVKVMLYIYLIIKSYTIYVALKTGKMGPLVKALSA